MAWIKRYWTAIVVIIAALVVADLVISTLATCHPPPEGSAEAVKRQYAEYCSYLHGPLLISLEWLVDAVNEHDGFFVVLFTAVLAAFTAALWRSTDKLWEAGERQLKATRSVAAIQARNTRRQLKIAEDTAERQLRAYVNVDRCLLVNFGVDRPISAVLHLRNSGNTPAYEVQCIAFFKTGKFPADRFAEDREPTRSSTMPPGATSTIMPGRDKPILLNDEQVKQVERKEAAIWVHGFVRYVDAFGKRRTTRYRMIYQGVVKTDPPGGMIFADQGNHSD